MELLNHEGEEKIFSELSKFRIQIFGTIGGTATIAVVTFILSRLNILPYGIILAMFFFVGLPTIFTFFLRIILNKPEYKIWARLGFALALIVSFVVFLFFIVPKTWSEFGWNSLYFLIGFGIDILIGTIYITTWASLKKQIFRIRGFISFAVACLVTIALVYLVKTMMSVGG